MTDLITAPQDTETHRATITELTPELAEAMLDAIRDRRLRLAAQYEQKQREKAQARSVRMQQMYDKALEQVKKKLEAADKALDAVEEKINRMRAFRLELEDLE